MDKEQKKIKEDLVTETTDKLGSAPMVTLKGQPFLDAKGDKEYILQKASDGEQEKGKPRDKTRNK